MALSDRNRLRLINLMGEDEVCVCFFTEILQMPQPKDSRHLAYLRRPGLVAARREGKWMHYRITPPTDKHALQILQNVRQYLARDREMQQDRMRLVWHEYHSGLLDFIWHADLESIYLAHMRD